MLVHPSYNLSTSDSDLALLRLRAAVPLGPYVVPVCLPTARGTFARTLAAVRVSTVSGWGRLAQVGPPANLLQRLEIPRVPLQVQYCFFCCSEMENMCFTLLEHILYMVIINVGQCYLGGYM